MKKIFKKTLSLMLCVAFAGMQMSLTAVSATLNGGTFAGSDVLSGTGAKINGHTRGLINVDTKTINGVEKATLEFNRNTRIDWAKLNVDKKQELYFHNYGFGVLNNVLGTSISKFAGTISADNGKIVISNPNGILYSGGKFESAGGLVLTTKDLKGIGVNDAAIEGLDFDHFEIGNAGGDNFSVIVIGGSTISSPDISIIANGVSIQQSRLSSPDQGGYVLVSTDGANYVAQPVAIGGMNIRTFNSCPSSISANSAILTNGGKIEFVSNGGKFIANTGTFEGSTTMTSDSEVAVSGVTTTGDLTLNGAKVGVTGNSIVNGNLKLNDTVNSHANGGGYADGAWLLDSTVNGDLTVNTPDNVNIRESKASGAVDITSNGQVALRNITFGTEGADNTNTVINADLYTRIYGTSKVHGDLTIAKANSLNLGYYGDPDDRAIQYGSLTVDGIFTANVDSTIGYSDAIVAKEIHLTSDKSSILSSFQSNGENGSLTADVIELIANKGEITSVCADLDHQTVLADPVTGVVSNDANGNPIMVDSSQYYELMATQGHITMDELVGKNKDGVTVKGGDATLSAMGAVGVVADLTGDLDVTSSRNAVVQGSIGGNVTATSKSTTLDNGTVTNPKTVELKNATVGGNATLKGGRVNVDGSNVAGNLKAEDTFNNHAAGEAYTNGVWVVNGSTVGGNLEVTSPDNVNIREAKVDGSVDVTANGQVFLRNVEFGTEGVDGTDTTISADLYTRIYGTEDKGSKIHGDLTIAKANSLNFGYYDTSAHTIQQSTLTVDGDLVANVDSTVGFSDTVKAQNITITSDKSSILSSYNPTGKNGSLEAYNITLTANKGEITSVQADQYIDLMSTQNHITMPDLVGKSKTGVDLIGGSATADAMGAVGINADLTGNLDVTTGRSTIITGEIDGSVKAIAHSVTLDDGTVTAPQTVQLDGTKIGKNAELTGGRINMNGVDVKGNVTAKDTYDNHSNGGAFGDGIWILNGSKIGGNLTAETPDNVNIRESQVKGSSDLKATDGQVNLRNVKMDGDVVANAGRRGVVYGNSEFGGDLDFTANSIHFGFFDTNNAITPGSVTVAGNLTANAPSTIGYSVDVTADKMSFTSQNSSFVQGNTDTFQPSLTANEITINTASGGIAVALDANTATAGQVDTYNYAMTRDYVVGAKSADEFAALNVKAKDGDTMTLNLGSGITNIESDADKTVAKGSVSDLKLTGNGAVEVKDMTAKKVANDPNDKTGSVVVATTKAGADIKVGNIVTDTDIIALNPLGTVTQTGILTADKEANNVGDVILGAKKLNDIGGNNAIKGANVTLTQTDAIDSITLSNITASAVGTDAAGDVTIAMPSEKVDLTNIHATHDITVLKNAADDRNAVVFDTIKLNNVIADSEENGRGDLNLKARNDILAENVGGANVRLTSTNGDITVIGAKSARHADDTTTAAQASNAAAGNKSGNIVVTAENGNILLNNLNAATDIIGTADNGAIYVMGNLIADAKDLTTNSPVNNADNAIGDVILSSKYFVGDNFQLPNSEVAIKGAGVVLTQADAQDNLVMSNITADAAGNDNSGDVVINIPVKNVDLNNIHATKDITVNNGTADGVLDSATLKNVIADSEENGIGDLNIKTKGDIDAQNIGGANITLESQNGNITVDGARSAVGNQADADAGNIKFIAKSEDAVISLGGISADTDILADASNGSINQTGNIIADAVDKNGVGTVTLKAKDGLDVGGNKGTIMGGDIVLEVNTGDIIASDLIADGQGDDNHGNISIHTPNGNVTIGTPEKAVTGTGDVTIVTDNGKANVVNTEADSEKNGIGTLTIQATDDVVASNVGGGNVVIETNGDITAEDVTAHAPNDENNGDIIITSGSGDVVVDGANADHDIIITPGKDADGNYIGDAKVNDAHADTDNDKKGDLVINGKNVIVDADIVVDQNGNEVVVPTGDNSTGNNVHINADNDVIADNVEAKDDIIINAGNDVIADNLIADNEPDGIGDLIINAGKDVDINGGDGSNVIIDAGNDVVAEDITAHGSDDAPHDDGNIIINAGGDVTTNDTHSVQDTEITGGGDINVTGAEADSDNDGKGDLIIHGKGDVTVEDGEGSNVVIISDDGDVDAKDITADGDDSNGDGNVIITTPNGDITVEEIDANKDIVLTVDGGKVTLKNPITPDLDDNGIGQLIINGVRDGGLVIDGQIASEVTRILNSLYQSGVDTSIAQSFTPIAFAAGDDEDDNYIAKRIAKTVFKTPETGIVTITERYKSVK